jgi:hypothetical protein
MSETLWVVPGDESQADESQADAGWEHGLPPGLTAAEWPRHRGSGLPLMHGFTLRVPESFRARGKERVALSYFHPGDSESYSSQRALCERVQQVLGGAALEGAETDEPFWQALAAHAASNHPATVYMRDILDHDHAIVWHREEALNGSRCPRPEMPLPEGIDGRAMHFEERVAGEQPLRFAAEEPERVHIQLGWPLHPVQADEDELRDQGFGDRVMEIETDVGGANYGDGNCQIDLDSGQLDWACT